MWNPFRSNDDCPVEPEMQQWVDGRFEWLGDELGDHVPRSRRVILPTAEFFPDPYDGTPNDAVALLTRVAEYMHVDPDRFRLFMFGDHEEPDRRVVSLGDAAGLYVQDGEEDEYGNPRASIGIAYNQLDKPMALVATIAHEIGHEILLGQGRLSREQPDHEPLTDLITVFLGLGIFGANASIFDKGWSSGTWSGWRTSKLGYLDQRTWGYALAKYAHHRAETHPAWLKHLRPDIKAIVKQGLRFLARNE
jgi:hypothetical protein